MIIRLQNGFYYCQYAPNTTDFTGTSRFYHLLDYNYFNFIAHWLFRPLHNFYATHNNLFRFYLLLFFAFLLLARFALNSTLDA